MESLYDWLFHYNPYEGLWYATKKEDYLEFFSGKDKRKSVTSPDIQTLITIIQNGHKEN